MKGEGPSEEDILPFWELSQRPSEVFTFLSPVCRLDETPE